VIYKIIPIIRSKPPAKLLSFRLHTFSLPKASPLHKHSSTGRTSWHSLTGDKTFIEPPPLKYSVPQYLPPLSLLSRSLSIFTCSRSHLNSLKLNHLAEKTTRLCTQGMQFIINQKIKITLPLLQVTASYNLKGGRTPTASRQASRHETKDAVLLHL
jgi:hypothetical protein